MIENLGDLSLNRALQVIQVNEEYIKQLEEGIEETDNLRRALTHRVNECNELRDINNKLMSLLHKADLKILRRGGKPRLTIQAVVGLFGKQFLHLPADISFLPKEEEFKKKSLLRRIFGLA